MVFFMHEITAHVNLEPPPPPPLPPHTHLFYNFTQFMDLLTDQGGRWGGG